MPDNNSQGSPPKRAPDSAGLESWYRRAARRAEEHLASIPYEKLGPAGRILVDNPRPAPSLRREPPLYLAARDGETLQASEVPLLEEVPMRASEVPSPPVEVEQITCRHCGHAGSTDHGTLAHSIACGEMLLARLAADVPLYLTATGKLRPEIAQSLDQLAQSGPAEVDNAISTLQDAGYTGNGKEAARRAASRHLDPDLLWQLRATERLAACMLAARNPRYLLAGCSCDGREFTRPLCGVHDISRLRKTPEDVALGAFWVASEEYLPESAVESVRPLLQRWVTEVGLPTLTDRVRAAAAYENDDPLDLGEAPSVGLDV